VKVRLKAMRDRREQAASLRAILASRSRTRTISLEKRTIKEEQTEC
jgi:hypothetical protein